MYLHYHENNYIHTLIFVGAEAACGRYDPGWPGRGYITGAAEPEPAPGLWQLTQTHSNG